MGWKETARAGIAVAVMVALASCGGGGGDSAVSGGGGTGGGTTGGGTTGGGGTGTGGTDGSGDGGRVGLIRPSVAPGYYALNSEGESGDGEGDGGGGDAGGGGDSGGGGIGAGGSLGAFANVQFKVTDEDDQLIGLVDVPTASAVTIYPPLDYVGLLKIEVIGSEASSYFDESLDANAPTGIGVIVRAVVSSASRRVGVTPFTTAAARLLEVEIEAGRASATSLEDMLAANQKTVDQINRFLPAANQIPDITTMPVLTNATTDLTKQSDSLESRYAQALAAFAIAAKVFNPQLKEPALAFTRNLERDMTDGIIDNTDKDGNAIAPAAELAYEADRLAVEVRSALAVVSSPPLPATGVVPGRDVCLTEVVAGDQVYPLVDLEVKSEIAADCLYSTGLSVGPESLFYLNFANTIGANTNTSYCSGSGDFVETTNDVNKNLTTYVSTNRLVAVSFDESLIDPIDTLRVLQRAVAGGVGAACPAQ